MSLAEQTILLVLPRTDDIQYAPIDWRMMAGEGSDARRIGHGTESTWAEIRRMELISGVARVKLLASARNTTGIEAARRYGWEVCAKPAEASAPDAPFFCPQPKPSGFPL